MPRVGRVEHVDGAAEQLALLPDSLTQPLYAAFESLREREFVSGEHVELLLVEGRAVRVNFFVDTDGTLWIERLGM